MNFSNYSALGKARKLWKKDPLAVVAVSTGSVVILSHLLDAMSKRKGKTSKKS